MTNPITNKPSTDISTQSGTGTYGSIQEQKIATLKLLKEYAYIIESSLATFKLDDILINYARFDTIDNTKTSNGTIDKSTKCSGVLPELLSGIQMGSNSNDFKGIHSTFMMQWHPRMGPNAIRVIILYKDTIDGNWVMQGFGSNFNSNLITAKGQSVDDINKLDIKPIIMLSTNKAIEILATHFDWMETMVINSNMSINDSITWDTFTDTLTSWAF